MRQAKVAESCLLMRGERRQKRKMVNIMEMMREEENDENDFFFKGQEKQSEQSPHLPSRLRKCVEELKNRIYAYSH